MTPTIRQEAKGDISAISHVLQQAFPSPEELRLVDAIRATGRGVLSLVAQAGDLVVGHILFTPLAVDRSPEDFSAVALAPLSVLPTFQRKGIGSLLIIEGLRQCAGMGIDMVCVLGNPNLYSRFGFTRAIDHGIGNEYGAVDAFMILTFQSGTLSRVSGTARYLPEFREFGV